MAIISNQLKGRVVLVANTSETHTVSSLANSYETILGARLTRIFFSGNVSVGNSTVTLLSLTGTDHWLLDESGAAIPFANTDSIVLTVGAGASAVVVIDKKVVMNANASANIGYITNS